MIIILYKVCVHMALYYLLLRKLKHLLERVIMKTFLVKLLVIKFLYHRLESGGL